MKENESVEEKLERSRSADCRWILLHSTYAGMVLKGNRVYKVYEDEEGKTFYRTFYLDRTTGEILTEEEYIFGKKLR